MRAKDTGLSYDVALDSVKRTDSTCFAVAVDKPLAVSEQQIADAFTELKPIPDKMGFVDQGLTPTEGRLRSGPGIREDPATHPGW